MKKGGKERGKREKKQEDKQCYVEGKWGGT